MIDQARYTLALRQAQATAQQRRATLDQARREDARNRTLGNLVAARGRRGKPLARRSRRGRARRRRSRDRHRAPEPAAHDDRESGRRLSERPRAARRRIRHGGTPGAVGGRHAFVSRRRLFRGNQAARHRHRPAGRHQGDGRAERCCAGTCRASSPAIEDRDRTQGSNLLPNVNPAFSWVRLAQRIPVRVALDEVPADFRMIAGRTATVSVRDLAPVERGVGCGRRRVLSVLRRLRLLRLLRLTGFALSSAAPSSATHRVGAHPASAALSVGREPMKLPRLPFLPLLPFVLRARRCIDGRPRLLAAAADAAVNAPFANAPLDGADGQRRSRPATVPAELVASVRRPRPRRPGPARR